MPEAGTISRLLAEAESRLRAAGIDAPALDARILLAECLGLEPSALRGRGSEGVGEAETARFEALLARRAAREPAYRILGYRPFYEHDFLLSAETLEPRSDTEILVDAAKRRIEAVLARGSVCRFCDVGTGTGAIAISLLALCPAARGIAVDISEDALRTTARNAERIGVSARIEVLRSDYLSAVVGPLELVVSNPPYIPTSQLQDLDPEVADYDPRRALDGGADGMDAYRAIAAEAGRVLVPGGTILLEIGFGQTEPVRAIFEAAGYAFGGATRDLGGVERVLCFEGRPVA